MFSKFLLLGATAVAAKNDNLQAGDRVVALFTQEHSSAEAEKVFSEVYDHFLENFDTDAHHHMMAEIEHATASFLESKAFNGYQTIANQPHCDAGSSSGTVAVKGMSAFPGGIVKRVFGFDLSKLVDKLASKANGAASAQGVLPGILAMQALSVGAGLVKSAVNSVLQIVPPLIPPPLWINQPLTCLPMVTGHNCFGATPYLITAANFITASTTDSQLDGVIAGFPALYKKKVGRTSDNAYKACFSAYMSMQCASIFPRCMVPMSRNEPIPIGSVPMCFTHCIATLVACPGFWIDDVINECQMVSVPPACTMALFSNMKVLPPQYSSFEDSVETPLECPSVPESMANFDASNDLDIYSLGGDSVSASPYGGATSMPNA